MNKSAIKNFAIWSRKKLISDIKTKAGLVGITEAGIASPLPQSARDVQFFDIGTKDYAAVRGNDIRKRAALKNAIEAKQKDCPYADAFRFVVEKAAYTWFNRLIAIRFMEVNDYLPSRVRVLSSENPGKAEPDMVTRPGDTDMEFTEAEHDYIGALWDENQLDELFRFLFIKQCRKLHEVLPELFDDDQSVNQPDSYLDFLLTLSYTDQDGVLWHLVHDIPEKDFRIRTLEDDERQKLENIPEEEMPAGQVEIIGWLYQYYNTEPKDRVFANLKKNIKISKDDIPAATQLFTPDWIVRYMVENSLGRLWVEGHPNEELKKSWKYYLEEAEQEPQVQAQLAEIRKGYSALRPEDIKVIDPCMGSGHILVRLFDVLMQIYDSQGWTARDAARSIVDNNLYGLDIDDRAAQLAYFAVMMKARQYDRRFLEQGIKPNVYGIQESNNVNFDHLKYFGGGFSDFEKNHALNQLSSLLEAFYSAKEYGSILEIPDLDWNYLRRFVYVVDMDIPLTFESTDIDKTQTILMQLLDQGEAMAQKCHVVVTNPPYMGSSGMSNKLAQFVKENYPDTKSDMSTVCMERCFSMCRDDGMIAMINIPVWMFLSSYEKLRYTILKKHTYINMVHPGRGVFGSDFGTTTFVIAKQRILGYVSSYRRLFDKQGEVESNEARERALLSGKGCFNAQQDSFSKIPGEPVAYWLPERTISLLSKEKLREKFDARNGITTGQNDLFIRLWFEVDRNNSKKWFPCNKGGPFRRWYGNLDQVIDWENDGWRLRNFHGEDGKSKSTLRSIDKRFLPSITMSRIGSSISSFRFLEKGFITEGASNNIYFTDRQDAYKLLAFLNTKVCQFILSLYNPTINVMPDDLNNLPITGCEQIKNTQSIDDCICMCKEDWDSFETSWDFQRHPLLSSSEKSELATPGEQAPDIDEKQMEFAIFCVENLAEDLGQDATEVFDLLTRESDLLYSYVIPCYEPLHSQDKAYIMDDIKGVMRERGLLP